MSKYSWHCCMCGQFVGWDADQSCYWGSSQDVEPPEPDYYCKPCAEEEKTRAIARGYVHNCYWIKPKWQLKAMKILEDK